MKELLNSGGIIRDRKPMNCDSRQRNVRVGSRIFDSVRDCASHYNIDTATVCNRIRLESYTGWNYFEEDEEC